MAVPVRPWYTGSVQLNTPATGALRILGSESLSVRERIDKIDTTSTASPKITSNGQVIVKKTSIQAGSELEIRVTGEYGAGGAGDPPQFGSNLANGTLYGDQKVILQAGDTFTDPTLSYGLNMLIDEYEVHYTKGDNEPIRYSLMGHSNGDFYRSTAIA